MKPSDCLIEEAIANVPQIRNCSNQVSLPHDQFSVQIQEISPDKPYSAIDSQSNSGHHTPRDNQMIQTDYLKMTATPKNNQIIPD